MALPPPAQSPSSSKAARTSRWVSEATEALFPSVGTTSVDPGLHSCLLSQCAGYPALSRPLTVIPENRTIDVASTPSIPEGELWDPAVSSGSITRLSSPAGSVKDWTSIETRLETFTRDLGEVPSATNNRLEELVGSQPGARGGFPC